jgi:hypothetical protein
MTKSRLLLLIVLSFLTSSYILWYFNSNTFSILLVLCFDSFDIDFINKIKVDLDLKSNSLGCVSYSELFFSSWNEDFSYMRYTRVYISRVCFFTLQHDQLSDLMKLDLCRQVSKTWFLNSFIFLIFVTNVIVFIALLLFSTIAFFIYNGHIRELMYMLFFLLSICVCVVVLSTILLMYVNSLFYKIIVFLFFKYGLHVFDDVYEIMEFLQKFSNYTDAFFVHWNFNCLNVKVKTVANALFQSTPIEEIHKSALELNLINPYWSAQFVSEYVADLKGLAAMEDAYKWYYSMFWFIIISTFLIVFLLVIIVLVLYFYLTDKKRFLWMRHF